MSILPPPPPGLSGSSCSSGANFQVSVSNGDGYLAHIRCESIWATAPSILYSLFTYPSNAALFRDIKRVENRSVVHSERGLKVIEVDQIGELKVLWMTRAFTTRLRVTEDERDVDGILKIKFELLRSDVLARFSGTWTLIPVREPGGSITGCKGILEQDVLPIGVPLFLQRVPVLGGLLRGISVRAISRLLEDVNMAVSLISDGEIARKAAHQVIVGLCGACNAEVQFSNGVVQSFALNECDDDSSSESQESGKDSPHIFVQLEVLADDVLRLHLLLSDELLSAVADCRLPVPVV